MAQTTDQVITQMDTEQANHPELASLNSTSNSAIYLLWKYVTAVIIVLFQELMDQFTTDIQTIVNSNDYGTAAWWYTKVIAYQYGDLLTFQNNVYQYPAINTANQIVQFCSVDGRTTPVQIKVAGSSNGQPAVLTADQLNGVLSYCQQIRPAGVKFTVISLVADLLQITGNVYYDASADITVVKPAVIAAINTYLQNLNTTTGNSRNFDGTLYTNKLIDAIQAVTGLTGNQFDLLSIAAKNGGDPYAFFTSSYQPKSGYFQIDPAFDLNNTLTFIAA